MNFDDSEKKIQEVCNYFHPYGHRVSCDLAEGFSRRLKF